MSAIYDYLTVTLKRGRPAWQGFATHVNGQGRDELAKDGAEVLGLFAPQLGFASNEATVLIRWPRGRPGAITAITQAVDVVAHHREELTPTLRPRDDATPRAGGIYVHRWFVIDGDRVEDFVDLSNQAWTGFEGAYDTEIFGLFTAKPTVDDAREGQARLLLLTYYASHGVWEASRDQTVDPRGLFVRRHRLTRFTVGRSCLLAPRHSRSDQNGSPG